MSKMVALIPAHNEAGSIRETIESVLAQTRVPDLIVVIPNGCTDETANIAREYPVTVLELPRLEHRKSEALNIGWTTYAQDADIVICMDADTRFPENAISDWERELTEAPWIGGTCAKFTVTGSGLLARMQRAEYAASIDSALRKGNTHVLPGAGCAFRGDVMREIAARSDREGPWSYRSVTEDYELTHRIREMGKLTRISPTVRAYTDSMPTVRALFGQRLKWQAGTIDDLFNFGITRLTWKDWGLQALGLLEFFLKVLLIAVLAGTWMLHGSLEIFWVWLLLPLLAVALSVKRSLRIPHRDWKDVVIAASFFPNEWMMWLRTTWFLRSWCSAIRDKIAGNRRDYWAAQYKSEGWG